MTADELRVLVQAFAPVVREYVAQAVQDVSERVIVTERQVEGLTHLSGLLDTLTGHVGTARERLAILETRAPVPGPSGPPGRDGADGLGFEDLTVEQMDDTTVTIKAVRGDQVKVIGSVTFPVVSFKGDYEAGGAYTPGNLVRIKNAIWHCRRATTIAPDAVTHDASGKPAGPQGKDFWTLVIRDGKRGSDGKDGSPGPRGPAGRDWQQVYDDTRRR